MPDYTTFETHLQSITSSNIQHDIIRHINGYAFHRLLLGKPDPSKSNILLTAGLHGDEPAGIDAVLQFLQLDLTDILTKFHILILPCVNPSGYARKTPRKYPGRRHQPSLQRRNTRIKAHQTTTCRQTR